MGVSGGLAWAIDAIARETILFAAAGFLLGGIDDLAIDLIYFARAIYRKCGARGARRLPLVADFPAVACSGRIVVFVAAWDESTVIGAMLRTALGRFDHPDYRLYVGTYPNDRATIEAVAAVAERDQRVRLVIGPRDGPTTKADCLNALWRALSRDEAAEGTYAKAIVLHDAEDVVHRAELAIFDRLIDRFALVQLPVLPLVDRGSRLVSGHGPSARTVRHRRRGTHPCQRYGGDQRGRAICVARRSGSGDDKGAATAIGRRRACGSNPA